MRVKRYETELSAKGKLPLLKEVESVKYGEGRLYFGSPDQISEMLNECFRLAYKTEESMYLCCYKSLAFWRKSFCTGAQPSFRRCYAKQRGLGNCQKNEQSRSPHGSSILRFSHFGRAGHRYSE